MRAIITRFAAVCTAALIFTACKKETNQAEQNSDEISQQVLKQIEKLGFSIDAVKKVDKGYLVEGDIILTETNLIENQAGPTLRIANEEQYSTTNLVRNFPRTISISVSNLGTAYVNATKKAIARYNTENLQLKFAFVSSDGQINIVGFNEGPSGGYITLGSAGFPTSAGNPYPEIRMNINQQAYGSNPDENYLASVLTHEIGHCIGFRHTDYMNRAFSCGGRKSNEGNAGVGAILIDGTPSKPDAESWMLACSNGGDRTFNTNDKIALNALY